MVWGRVRAVVADAVPRGVPWAPGTRVRADAAGVWLDGAGTPDASPAHVPFGGFVGLAGGTASCLAALRGPDGTVAARLGATGLVSATPEMLAVFHRVVVASAASEPALLLGESGTGKELLARALHDAGPRRGAPFVAVNLAAVPRELAEAELFGCVRGAFTGAVLGRAGAFEAAGAGTLFLDELAESAPEVQAKLLRAVECGAVRRVGASGETPVRARIVAATQRDPARAVAGGALRADLADRLAPWSSGCRRCGRGPGTCPGWSRRWRATTRPGPTRRPWRCWRRIPGRATCGNCATCWPARGGSRADRAPVRTRCGRRSRPAGAGRRFPSSGGLDGARSR
ncbi:MAG TPA: sigma-54 factor interaction domain-containing protein [Myxococcota bacterium]|nr:sigma-54 factor interaction domain-containing protein [Myxococcota bacterium]